MIFVFVSCLFSSIGMRVRCYRCVIAALREDRCVFVFTYGVHVCSLFVCVHKFKPQDI